MPVNQASEINFWIGDPLYTTDDKEEGENDELK
jgi:hypothetical protein